MHIPTDIALAMLAVASVLPLYVALDRIGRRLRALERRFDDGAADAAKVAGSTVQTWRHRLAAMEAAGDGATPRAEALRRRLGA